MKRVLIGSRFSIHLTGSIFKGCHIVTIKRKKNICWFWFIIKGAEYIFLVGILFYNYSFPRINSLSLVSFYSFLVSCSCFLDLITSWDKTWLLCLDWVQLVLKELERENSWGKRQESVRLLSKKSQLRVKHEWSVIIRV